MAAQAYAVNDNLGRRLEFYMSPPQWMTLRDSKTTLKLSYKSFSARVYNMFNFNIREWVNSILVFAAKDPGSFLAYVLLGLAPLFLISAILSWKLAKYLEQQEKEKKRKAKRGASLAKVRGHNKKRD